MKYLILSFLISCKVNMEGDVTQNEKTIMTSSNELFEGRYYFSNGGIVEMYNDFNNQVTTLSNPLIFPNSNNTLATLSFPALSKHDILDNKVISSMLTMTGVQASNFVGNIQGNASNGVQLVNTSTYRYQVSLTYIDGLLNVTLEIQQLNGVLYTKVYKNTLIEI